MNPGKLIGFRTKFEGVALWQTPKKVSSTMLVGIPGEVAEWLKATVC
jgi:hypothetical protein